MLKHKNWLVLVLLVLFLSACSKEKEKTAKVLKEQPTNIPIDKDLSKTACGVCRQAEGEG